VSDNEAQVEGLVRRYREIGAVIEEMKAEQAEIKSRVDGLVQLGWKSTVDGQPVHKREPNRSFCPITAVDMLSPEQRKNCQVHRYDDKMLRAAVDSIGKLDDCMLLKADALPVLKL
jgi:hypothetical protein